MGKLRQGSTEKQVLEDKSKYHKGVRSSSTIKAKLPEFVITKFNGTHIYWIKF